MDQTIGLKDGWKFLAPAVALFAALEVLMWVHWNSLVETARGWDNPKYQFGYLVPLSTVFLLWLWRDPKQDIVQPLLKAGLAAAGLGLLLCFIPVLAPDLVTQFSSTFGRTSLEAAGVTLAIAGALLILQPQFDVAAVTNRDRWIGFGVLVGAELLRYWATVTSKAVVDDFSIVPAIAGVVIMVGGLPIMRWAGWPIFVLSFMMPLPAYVDAQSGNLQLMSARSTTFLLQTMGFHVERQGHVVKVGDPATGMQSLEVARACSGLSMLTILCFLCVFMALIFRERPLWQRLTIIVSSVPIALVSNILRITVTGMLFSVVPANLRGIAHDITGNVIMMPIAMILIFLEFKIMDHLVIEEDEELPPPGALMGMQRSPAQQLTSGGRITSVANGGPRECGARRHCVSCNGWERLRCIKADAAHGEARNQIVKPALDFGSAERQRCSKSTTIGCSRGTRPDSASF